MRERRKWLGLGLGLILYFEGKTQVCSIDILIFMDQTIWLDRRLRIAVFVVTAFLCGAFAQTIWANVRLHRTSGIAFAPDMRPKVCTVSVDGIRNGEIVGRLIGLFDEQGDRGHSGRHAIRRVQEGDPLLPRRRQSRRDPGPGQPRLLQNTRGCRSCGLSSGRIENATHRAACHGELDEPSRGVALRQAQGDTAFP